MKDLDQLPTVTMNIDHTELTALVNFTIFGIHFPAKFIAILNLSSWQECERDIWSCICPRLAL